MIVVSDDHLFLSLIDMLSLSLSVDAATKLIARIRKCSIIVSDASRVHHFSPDGRCSCEEFY